MDADNAKIDISIIIPVYNVENYLDQCLNSICNQYNKSIQIICIDDCSTDRSLDILYEWKTKYSNIEIYQNSQNSGLAYTRNVGISYARGEYLMFVDSDDYIAENVIALLHEKAQGNNVDILVFSVKMFSDEEYPEIVNQDLRVRKAEYICQKGVNVISEMVQKSEMFGAVWTAIYRLDFINSKRIRFIPGILHEDIPFFFKSVLQADRVCGVVDIGYYYRQRTSSILHHPDYNKLLEGLFIGYLDIINTWYWYNQKADINKDVVKNINKYLDSILCMIKNRYDKNCLVEDIVINPALENFMQNLSFGLSKNEFFSARIFRNKRVVVYGAGNRARKIILELKENDVFIERIYVTNKAYNPDNIMDIEVSEFSKDSIRPNFLVLIAVKYCDEIVEMLEMNGIKNYLCV